jgi:hypothetical protein
MADLFMDPSLCLFLSHATSIGSYSSNTIEFCQREAIHVGQLSVVVIYLCSISYPSSLDQQL